MENCERYVSKYEGVPGTKPDQILTQAAVEAKSPGSSTVLVAHFDGQVCNHSASVSCQLRLACSFFFVCYVLIVRYLQLKFHAGSSCS